MSRRDVIADAAITTLAAAGMRGLTHRAVDRAAGLSEGSTSYYARTRAALIHIVLDRLVELDEAEIPAGQPVDLDTFADVAARHLENRLTVGRDRELARYELALEATRRPQLREHLVDAGARVRVAVAELLAAAGVAEPAERAYDFTAYVDGIVFDQTVGAGTRELGVDRLREMIRGLLAAVGESG